MKNIQVIDGAANCSYSIYKADNELFKMIFPEDGQDIEFIDDFVKRCGEERAGELLRPLWGNCVVKQFSDGIHGTLFFELNFKRRFYPNKRESDLNNPVIQSRAF